MTLLLCLIALAQQAEVSIDLRLQGVYTGVQSERQRKRQVNNRQQIQLRCICTRTRQSRCILQGTSTCQLRLYSRLHQNSARSFALTGDHLSFVTC